MQHYSTAAVKKQSSAAGQINISIHPLVAIGSVRGMYYAALQVTTRAAATLVQTVPISVVDQGCIYTYLKRVSQPTAAAPGRRPCWKEHNEPQLPARRQCTGCAPGACIHRSAECSQPLELCRSPTREMHHCSTCCHAAQHCQ
jgi:hypothetical protein